MTEHQKQIYRLLLRLYPRFGEAEAQAIVFKPEAERDGLAYAAAYARAYYAGAFSLSRIASISAAE